MPHDEMTDEEVRLALEVHAHNERERERAIVPELVARHLGIDLPDAARTDADGRWTYDHGAMKRHIDGLGMLAARALLSRARATTRDLHHALLPVEWDILGRIETLRTQAFERELAAMDDPEVVEARRRELAEDRDEIECSGAQWHQDPFNAIPHAGLAARVAACDARLAELAPVPAP